MKSQSRSGCVVESLSTSVCFLATFALSQCIWAANVSAEADLRRGNAEFESQNGEVLITSDFPGGRMSKCSQISEDTFAVTIAPEADPINDSAWYAFRVHSQRPQTIRIRLHYIGGSHRYDPKISHDGENWQPAMLAI